MGNGEERLVACTARCRSRGATVTADPREETLTLAPTIVERLEPVTNAAVIGIMLEAPCDVVTGELACFMGRTLPQWAAARAALQRGAPPPHNVWISDVLLVVAVTLTGALLVAIAAVVALRREGWGHRVKA